MTTIENIVAPHNAVDSALVARLIAAYSNDADVPVVVALDFGHSVRAITGSHRIAAMREVFEPHCPCDGLVVIVDGNDLYDAASDGLRIELDRLMDNKGVDFSELCAAIVAEGLVCDDVAALLDGQ